MRILLDTNILLRMAHSNHPKHSLTVKAISALRSQNHALCIVPQSIYEFWSVATRSEASNGLGKPPSYAQRLVPKFCGLFKLLRDESSMFDAWLALVTSHEITSVHCFDARLAAAMHVHELTHLLTFDGSDFRQFRHVSVLAPEEIVKS